MFHEYGNENPKIIVMIHGTAMSWKMFVPAAEALADTYHVILAGVPGHDPDRDDEFTSVEQTASEIEEGLLHQGINTVDLLYGLSMGGGIVLRMLADSRLTIRHAVIDGGIAPYEFPKTVCALILAKDVVLTGLAKHSRRLLSCAFSDRDYGKETVDGMYQVLRHMSARTIFRVYASTDNYSMSDVFPETDTEIEYWYGSEEEKERKTDIQYFRKHIPHVRIRILHGMKHGQYAAVDTESFVKDLRERI